MSRQARRRLPAKSELSVTNRISFVCTCRGRTRLLKKVAYHVDGLADLTPARFRGWVRPRMSLENIKEVSPEVGIRRYAKVEYGANIVGRSGPQDDLTLVVDEPYAPALYRMDAWGGDADSLLRNGFERVVTKNEDGYPHEYYKARLRCPHCRRDAALGPELADRLVRDLATRGVSRYDLGEVLAYLERE